MEYLHATFGPLLGMVIVFIMTIAASYLLPPPQ